VITTIMMFVPFMLFSGPIQAWSSQISLVVIAVLAFSLIEAFFILPAHLRHLKPIPENQKNPLLRLQNKIANTLVIFAKNTFRPIVAFLIRFRYATFATFCGLLWMAFALLGSGVAPSSFFPEVEGDVIAFNARFPEGTTFERREQARAQVDAGIFKLNENAKNDFGLDFELIEEHGTFTNRRSIEGYFGLVDGNKRKLVSSKMIADKLEEYVGPIPDAYRVSFGVDASGGGGAQGIRYAVAAQDVEALDAAVKELKTELESYDSVTRAWDSLESSSKEIRFTLKPGAETLGITLATVTRQVREAFYGREVQRLPRDGEDVRVMVRYPEAARESIDSLQSLRIRAANGVEVPLYSVTGARVRGDGAEVNRIRVDMNTNFLPDWEKRHPGVSRINVGDDDMQRTMQRELTLFSAVIFFMMYILLAIAFKSYAQPLLIMIAIPFAFVGMIFGNLVTGIPFGMMSIFGFFAAAGVAVNDNLVLIDYVNRLRAKGVGAYQAMLDACVARFRPILLTSVTTFIGIAPILFETSVQAGFLKPMVVALAFGVLFDFFLTLMLVPAMYGIGVDISRLFRSLWRGKWQPMLGSSYDPEMALALEGLDAEDATGPKPPITAKPVETF